MKMSMNNTRGLKLHSNHCERAYGICNLCLQGFLILVLDLKIISRRLSSGFPRMLRSFKE